MYIVREDKEKKDHDTRNNKSNKIKAKDDEINRGDSLVQDDSQPMFKCERCEKLFWLYKAPCGNKHTERVIKMASIQIKNICSSHIAT